MELEQLKGDDRFLSLIARLGVGEEEDWEEEDDEESEYEEDEDSLTLIAMALKTAFGGIEKPKEKEVKTRESIEMTRTNIETVVKCVKEEPGINKVVAQPGSGKTSVFPSLYSGLYSKQVCVVVPSSVILASVVARNGFSWVDLNGDSHGTSGSLFYMTVKTFNGFHLSNSHNLKQQSPVGSLLAPDTALIFDEAQMSGEYARTVDQYSTFYGGTNTVIQMHGSYVNKESKIGDNMRILDCNSDELNQELRVLRLYARETDVIEGFKNDSSENKYYLDSSDIDSMIDLLKTCALEQKFTIHANISSIIGLDLPNLTAVVGIREYFHERNLVQVSRAEHIQFMSRAGRDGSPARYYIERGMLPLTNRPKNMSRSSASVDKMFELIRRATVKPLRIFGKKKRFINKKEKEKPVEGTVVSFQEPKKRISTSKVFDVTQNTVVNEEDLDEYKVFMREVNKNAETIKSARKGTKVVLASHKLGVGEIACLPVVHQKIHERGSFYDVGTIRKKFLDGYDVSDCVVTNYNYAIDRARELLQDVYFSKKSFKRQEDHNFYQVYTATYTFLKEMEQTRNIILTSQYYADVECENEPGKLRFMPFLVIGQEK